MKTMREMIDRS